MLRAAKDIRGDVGIFTGRGGTTEPLKGFPDHGPRVQRVFQAAYEEVSASTAGAAAAF